MGGAKQVHQRGGLRSGIRDVKSKCNTPPFLGLGLCLISRKKRLIEFDAGRLLCGELVWDGQGGIRSQI